MTTSSHKRNLMIDPVENILSRLDKVKQVKPDSWKASCPAHNDRNPSLSIKRTGDGTVLLKCWAGCSATDVTHSLGLSLADLFNRPDTYLKPGRERIYPNYRTIMRLVRHEITVLLCVVTDIRNGKEITDKDYQAFNRAYDNLQGILGTVNE